MKVITPASISLDNLHTRLAVKLGLDPAAVKAAMPEVTAWMCITQITYCARHDVDAYDPTGECISCYRI